MGRVQEKTRKFWNSTKSGANNTLKKIDRFFVVALQGRAFMAASHVDSGSASELIPLLQKPAREEPGALAFVFQPTLWGRCFCSGRGINIDVVCRNLDTNYCVALTIFFIVRYST